jgi:hypothetical protein
MSWEVNQITHLFSLLDVTFGENDDPILAINLNTFSHTVRVAGMINVPGEATTQCGINHSFLIQSEHVNTGSILFEN